MTLPTSPPSTVMFVEDDDDLRDSLLAILETRGYGVHGYDSAESAISAISDGSCQPQIIVMDGNLPGMRGRDAISRILAMQPNIQFLAMSGEPNCREEMLNAGAKVFLEKPVEIPIFLQTMNELSKSNNA